MKIAMLLLAATLVSCETPAEALKKRMDSWLNHHKSELLQSWGPPTRRTDDGSGGEILSWESSRTSGGFIGNNYIRNTNIDYRDFYCDSQGRIYRWRAGSR